MSTPFAKVPVELVERVDAAALQLYVALCKYAGRDGRCYPSNAELSRYTGQSPATIRRSLAQLIGCGAISRHNGTSKARTFTISSLSNPLTHEHVAEPDPLTHERATRSPMSDGSKYQEVDTDTLTSFACHTAAESETEPMSDDELFDSDGLRKPKPEPVGTTKAMRAFFDAYGTEPLSRSMISRLGRKFKQLCETYDDELVSAAAREMGMQHVANPNAVESFILALRRRRAAPAEGDVDAQWSAIARDTFDQWRGEARSV